MSIFDLLLTIGVYAGVGYLIYSAFKKVIDGIRPKQPPMMHDAGGMQDE